MTNLNVPGLKIFYLELGQFGGLLAGVSGLCLGLAVMNEMSRPVKWAWLALVAISLLGSVWCWGRLRWHRVRLRRRR